MNDGELSDWTHKFFTKGQKFFTFQVFDLSFNPMFDENDKFPAVAIVAPNRLLYY